MRRTVIVLLSVLALAGYIAATHKKFPITGMGECVIERFDSIERRDSVYDRDEDGERALDGNPSAAKLAYSLLTNNFQNQYHIWMCMKVKGFLFKTSCQLLAQALDDACYVPTSFYERWFVKDGGMNGGAQ